MTAASIPKKDQPVRHYRTGKQYKPKDYDGSEDEIDVS